MLETIHIFDEFSHSPDELTRELRHKKRMALDPLLYDILKYKYSAKLEAFWKDHKVPTETDSYLVFIERRLHPNLAFVLTNAAYFARDYGVVLICSDVNYEYCKTICQGKNVDIRPFFQGNPEPHIGKEEYNSLQQDATFYESLPGKYWIFFEVDCYFRKPIPLSWKQYDYIAAPYEWDETSFGGGLSFRKKEAMLAICNSDVPKDQAADHYLCQGVKTLGLKVPPFEEAMTYMTESCIYEDPIGVHQWWTFFFPNQTEDAEEIMQSLLSLNID